MGHYRSSNFETFRATYEEYKETLIVVIDDIINSTFLYRRRKFLLVTRWNSLVARYSLQNSLVARCRSCSLQKITRYSLQKLLVAKHHSLLVAEVARCKKSLVSPCRSCSLQKITRYPLQKLLVAKNRSLLVAKFACCSLQKLLVANNHLSLIMKKTGELMFI